MSVRDTPGFAECVNSIRLHSDLLTMTARDLDTTRPLILANMMRTLTQIVYEQYQLIEILAYAIDEREHRHEQP
jgi:hypothetical protein